MPTDVVGDEVALAEIALEMTFVPGPVFNNILLADEINRAPPKAQSACWKRWKSARLRWGACTRLAQGQGICRPGRCTGRIATHIRAPFNPERSGQCVEK